MPPPVRVVVSGYAGPVYEVLEHTADVRLRVWGGTREGVFASALLGLMHVLAPEAGRCEEVHSRAREEIDSTTLRSRLKGKGIVVESGSVKGLVEEAPEAYKDVDAVVDIVDRAGIASKVARLRPLAVVKG